MADKSAIEWLADGDGMPGSTWNPLRARFTNPIAGAVRVGWHCELCSPGCVNCYAQQINKGFFNLGTTLPYVRSSRDKAEIFLDEKTLEQPLHWKKPRRIFVCSMTDLFGEFHSDEMIGQVFAVMALAPQHTFLVLTKRAERMWRYCLEYHGTVPIPNVHLGVSCEDQKTADERIPFLQRTPAAVRWISYEPALGPADFHKPTGWYLRNDSIPLRAQIPETLIDGISWIVVGGESGPDARACDLQWIRSAVEQCKTAGVAVFVKQLGALPHCGTERAERINGIWEMDDHSRVAHGEPGIFQIHSKKGGDINEFPEDLRIREYPR